MRALAARLVAGWRCDLVFNIAEGVPGFGADAADAAAAASVGAPEDVVGEQGEVRCAGAQGRLRRRAAPAGG